jgi:hypothetical protein
LPVLVELKDTIIEELDMQQFLFSIEVTGSLLKKTYRLFTKLKEVFQ